MRAPNRLLASVSLCVALTPGLCSAASAAAPSTHTDIRAASAQLRLVTSHTEPAPQQSGRYSLRARFQREESAGELREGGEFELLGRFTKAGASCDANTLFRNGFEG